MKSSLPYDMHNYAVMSSPINLAETKAIKEQYSVGEKYSLRQRQKRKATAMSDKDESLLLLGYASDNSSSEKKYTKSSSSKKTAGRKSRTSRESKRNVAASNSALISTSSSTSSSASKSKTKAAPLSKYRRKTANARERTRMREINSAFENLRHCVPHSITGDDTGSTNEKLTKITTLRLAMKYIQILSEALTDPTFEANLLLECQRDGDDRFTTPNYVPTVMQNVDVDIMTNSDFSDNSISKVKSTKSSPKTKKASSTNVNANTTTTPSSTKRKATSKRQSKKQKLQQSTSPYEIHSSLTSESAASSISPASAFDASLSSILSLSSSDAAASPPSSSASSMASNCSYLFDTSIHSNYISNINQSVSELNTLILESDGESLHLSDHCLSPLQKSYHNSLLGSNNLASKRGSTLSLDTLSRDTIALSSMENPLELSLRLLESSPLDFSVDQPPTSCISPLVTLDSFNPFGDLLHSDDFAEHNSMDLFLT